MRVHFSSIVTIFVALLFVSGTTGCVSKGGGPWYNPSSYTFANPFDKKEKPSSAPVFGETLPNVKPSLDGTPNIGAPPGGYTDASSLASTRTDSTAGTISSSPPEHWTQQSQIASQSSTGPYGGYTAASQYSSYDPYGGQSTSASPYQYSPQGQSPPQYASGASQYHSQMPLSDTTPPGYHMTSAASSNAYSPQTNTVVDNGGGNYTPYGVTPQYDPLYATQHQPVTAAPPSGYNHGEVAPNPFQGGYPGDALSVAQPYQQPASSGYNYNY